MGGFRFIHDELIHDMGFLRLVRGHFKSPDDDPMERAIVRMNDAVAIVPVMYDGDTVMLVQQYRGPLDRLLLEIPAGMCDVEGESLEDCARRELKEELGIEVDFLDRLCEANVAAGFTDHKITIFIAGTIKRVDRQPHGPEEHYMTEEHVKLSDAPKLIVDGIITDSKTIMGLLAAREYLKMR